MYSFKYEESESIHRDGSVNPRVLEAKGYKKVPDKNIWTKKSQCLMIITGRGTIDIKDEILDFYNQRVISKGLFDQFVADYNNGKAIINISEPTGEDKQSPMFSLFSICLITLME